MDSRTLVATIIIGRGHYSYNKTTSAILLYTQRFPSQQQYECHIPLIASFEDSKHVTTPPLLRRLRQITTNLSTTVSTLLQLLTKQKNVHRQLPSRIDMRFVHLAVASAALDFGADIVFPSCAE